MTTYGYCPGRDCGSKVKVKDDGNTNFCCVPCWNHTWSEMSDSDFDPEATMEHTDQCLRRQVARRDEPASEAPNVITVRARITQ